MQSWYLGSEAGYATANVVSGEVNPSGKMPFSIPVKLEDNAAHHFGTKAFPGDGTDVVYEEGILVGYRWHDTKKIPALFPFGYGMSYTTFSYGKMATNKKVYGKEDTSNSLLRLPMTGNVRVRKLHRFMFHNPILCWNVR